MSDDIGDGKQPELLPLANVVRIMKKVLPQDAKVTKEGRMYVRNQISYMISYVICEALDRNEIDGRRTVSGDDIIDSLRALGFDQVYIDYLSNYLRHFRSQKKQMKASMTGTGGLDEDLEEEEEDSYVEDD